ncbi:uncharacterized protein B0H18DRAFT_1123574 [Fomitopsis serialis]|uniref:uncharacterized protein n=1 Tax=Fomitopsis serialis TaxID=139415 RepID=UPI0020085F2A|nr:uncharacterized protein B0H18DRAFT_1123574 [Neoantrodia serialis]KAH9917490.1 hypothetical protein B0H18DRAFT_1123574 [Neoantrodia serialis]
MRPLANEPSWSTIVRDENTVGPGSELLSDQHSRWTDGIADNSFGLTLRTSFPFDEVAARLRYAIAHLRFTSPLVASTLEEGIHGPRFRSWVYTPASSVQDAIDWAQAAVVVLPYRIHADDLVSEVVKVKLPYVLPSGRELIFRCFLARSSAASPDGGDSKLEASDDVVYIVFHSTHVIQDARSTSTRFRSGEEPTCGARDSDGRAAPELGDGGNGTDGQDHARVCEPGAIARLTPQRPELGVPARLVKIVAALDEDQTARVVAATKASGFTMSHLLVAAHKLAVLSYHDTTDPSVRGARIQNPMVPFALQRRYQVPSHDDKGKFVSAICWIPIRASMRAFKAQYDEHQRNPHLPHVSAAIVALAPPNQPAVSNNPYCSIISNIGATEAWLPDHWYRDNAEKGEIRSLR